MLTIGIIAAMQEEHDGIIEELGVKHTIFQEKQFVIHRGEYAGTQLYLMLSGIGKVNAAMHTQFMIDKFAPAYIINTGVAGSLSDNVHLGDVVIADDLVQYDVDVTAFGLVLGQIPRLDVFAFVADTGLIKRISNLNLHASNNNVIPPTGNFNNSRIHTGRIVSGDKFINAPVDAQFLSQTFNALACEMEGAAIAQVCHINKTPFVVIRTISDVTGQEDNSEKMYNMFKAITAKRSAFIVKQLLASFAKCLTD